LHVVLVLDHAHINGGQAKLAIESALGLRARGHAVTLFAAVGPVDARLTEAGVAVVCLGQDDVHSTRNKLAFAAQVIWNAAAARALRGSLAKCGPTDTLVPCAWLGKGALPVDRAGARLVRAAARLHHARVLPGLPERRLLRLPGAAICHRRPMSLPCIARNCDSKSYPRKVLRLARHAALDHLSGMKEAIRHVILISRLQE
jgi:hypothetical protein